MINNNILGKNMRRILLILPIIIGFSSQHGDITATSAACYTLMICIALLVFITFFLKSKMWFPREMIVAFCVFIIFTIFSLVATIFQGVSFIRFFIVYFSYLFLFLGVLLGIIIVQYWSVESLMKIMIVAASINTLYVVAGYILRGGELDDARYHIVGALMPLTFMLFFAYFISNEKIRIRVIIKYAYLIVIFAAVLVLIISKTRTYFICVIGAAFIMILLANRRILFSSRLIQISFGLILFAIICLSIPTVNDYFSAYMERFALIGSDDDVTSSTRMAEYSYQMKSLFSSTENLIMGCGLGHQYYYDLNYFTGEMAKAYDYNRYLTLGGETFGHSLYVYLLYSSGIVVFSLLVIMIFSLAFTLVRYGTYIVKKQSDVFICLCLITFLLLGGFMSPIGQREGAFVFGLAIGGVLSRRKNWIKQKNKIA